MLGIIQSELLKMRHTFCMKLIILAPLAILLLGYLLSGRHVQLSTYNWWYFMVLPLVVSLCSASMIAGEKKSGMQNMVILLFMTNLFLWIATTVAGMAASVTVSPLDGLIGCMLLFLTYLWQIPVIMQLTCFMGHMKVVFVSLAANVILSAVCAEKEWFLFVPYAIPARVVCPFFKIHVNGIPLEDASSLLSAGYVFPAVIVSLVFALAAFWGGAKLFSRGGWVHE